MNKTNAIKEGRYTPPKDEQYIVGIDEVGRGPVAGPVTVCALHWLSKEHPTKIFSKIKDSKKLTEQKREEFFKEIQKHNNKLLTYSTSSIPAKEIDTNGIIHSLKTASTNTIKKLSEKNNIKHILSDYGLPLPDTHPSTHIIKGDEQEPLIALASIIAKVTRDNTMKAYGEKYPEYNFQKHKGYYTKEHKQKIEKYGLSPIHRKTFLKNTTE